MGQISWKLMGMGDNSPQTLGGVGGLQYDVFGQVREL
jgi:hypothetical protein